MTDITWDFPEPACGLSLVPVRTITVVPRGGGHDVIVRADGETVAEYWCDDAQALTRALDYCAWVYPDAIREGEGHAATPDGE